MRVVVAKLFGLHSRWRMQTALAFECHLLRIPRHRRLLMQQEGAVLEIALTKLIVHLLIRRPLRHTMPPNAAS